MGPPAPDVNANRLDLVGEDFPFPTSLTRDEAGNIYVAESGLPFGGAPPGGRVWLLAPDGSRRILVDGLRPPVNGLTFHHGSLYVSKGGHPGRAVVRIDPSD
jgi:sugar lactone lactonase YvrE